MVPCWGIAIAVKTAFLALSERESARRAGTGRIVIRLAHKSSVFIRLVLDACYHMAFFVPVNLALANRTQVIAIATVFAIAGTRCV